VERKPMGLLTLMRMIVIKVNIIRITVRYGKSRYIFAKVQVIVKVLVWLQASDYKTFKRKTIRPEVKGNISRLLILQTLHSYAAKDRRQNSSPTDSDVIHAGDH
jgi:hypothetical protein